MIVENWDVADLGLIYLGIPLVPLIAIHCLLFLYLTQNPSYYQLKLFEMLKCINLTDHKFPPTQK